MTAQPQFITNSNGDKTAVILTLDDYQTLLEDLEDLAAIAELKDEDTVPWDQVKKELYDSGLLIALSLKNQLKNPCLTYPNPLYKALAD